MFLRILKNDLKRRKTMNAIMLVFIILSTMFAGASVNNISAVTGGIDHFFDEAGIPDVVVTSYDDEGKAKKEIEKIDGVSDVWVEHSLQVFSPKNFKYDGKKLDNFINPALLISEKEFGIKYFDKNNEVIKGIKKGTFYCSSPFVQNIDVKEGDRFELDVEGVHLDLEYKGIMKGAITDTASTASPYLLVNDEDYEYVKNGMGDKATVYQSIYIKTSDVDAVKAYAENDPLLFASTREDEKGIYLFDMMVAYVMMGVSIIIMATAFIVLRFTIGFTIQEEFREIGVMKAIGIPNMSIRGLYIIKYFAIAVVGASIGFFCSIPLSNVMLNTVSQNMVLGSENGVQLGIISAAGIVAVIMLFCYFCTLKVRKFSPIDAVRSGQTGERFHKKSLMHLGKSKLPTTGFLAANDVTSAPKQFLVITLVFTLCMLMMTTMAVSADTLKSEKLVKYFCVSEENDITFLETDLLAGMFSSPDGYKESLEKADKLLEDCGIDGDCSMMCGTSCDTVHGDKSASNIYYIYIKGESPFKLECNEGSAPQKNDEIAMTQYALDKLGAEIGDKITTTMGDKEYEFIITGTFSTYMGNGYGAFLYKDFDTVAAQLKPMGTAGIQVKLKGDSSEAAIQDSIDKLKIKLDSDKVYTNTEMVKTMTQVSDSLNAVKKLMMVMTIILVFLVIMLMERSFISKEKSEVALMKAVGVSGRSIIGQHILRFVIVAILACIISSAAVMPLSASMLEFVSKMIGDVNHISVDYKPVEIFAVCPAILLAATVIGTFITALHMRRIKASDTASIE